MVGVIAIIFVLLPESPWWLASVNKLEQTKKVLLRCHGHIEGYDVQQQVVRPSVTSLRDAPEH
jgi:SP family general alpha glucoside:H+ symporter-like MFS transporter